MNRREFIISSGAGGVCSLTPNIADAYLPIFGAALAELALSFGVRLGARTMFRTALNLGGRASVTASRQIWNASRKMTRSGFTDLSKSQVQVSVGVSGSPTMFFTALSGDGYNACIPFINEGSSGDDRATPMIEAPALYYLMKCTQDHPYFNDKSFEHRHALIMPKYVLRKDMGSTGQGNARATSFTTEAGHCVIATASKPVSDGVIPFVGGLKAFDKQKREIFSYRGSELFVKT